MRKATRKILKNFLIFMMVLEMAFSNIPFYAAITAIDSYLAARDIVDKAFHLSQDENVVDKFNSFRNLAEGIKVQEAHAAASYIGNSNMIYTNGGAPGAITPNASTLDGDLLVFYHYSRATGGNETVNLPAGFTPVFNSVTASRGLVAVGWRIKQAGDGTFQANITNHTAGTTGETVIEFIQTYRGTDATNPIVNYTASLSNWTSSLNIGPIAAPAIATVNDGDMTVVFGGRFENVTGQTVLAGDSLTWAVRTTANTTQGTDAGAVVQTGLNSTGASQTVTAKTVTTTGTAQAGAGRMFIIKKQANTAPALTVSQPDGVGDTVNVGDPYDVTYTLSDAEDIVTAAFYYDTDGVGLNGTAISGACATAPAGTNVTCSWDTTGMSPGSYYVYGITSDGVNPQVSDYSPGMITINSALPDATLVSYEIGGDGARSSYSATITGSNFGTVSAGSRANCTGGVGTGCVRFIVGGNATVADADVTAWSNTSITFTVNANLTSYGGLASLRVVSAGASDSTPLDFYIYPNITSAPANGQIGENITVSGDHFGGTAGTIKINGVTVTPGSWNDISISNVIIPGQTSVINGQIEVIRNASIDSKNDLSNFTTLGPLITSSNPTSGDNSQNDVTITFSGSGFDTDTGTSPVLKLTRGAKTITGTLYNKVNNYTDVQAHFDLTGVLDSEVGYWKLVIENMDTLSGFYGDESTYGFYINLPAPIVTGINPAFGLNTENNKIINSITGSNFGSGATVKLTHSTLTQIGQSTAFTYNAGNGNLENGSFDLTGQTENLWWNVVVTQGSQSGSYGNEIDTGFEIRLSKPSLPSNLIQSKTEGGASVAVGGGIGGQTTIYFGMDMSGGLTGELYYSQVEIKPIDTPFDGTFTEGSGVLFNGTAVQGWVNINGADGVSYHWQARVRNSAGTSNWVSFGGNTDPSDVDFYLDNTAPIIVGECPASSISDSQATIDWNTNVNATAQVEYKLGTISESWGTPGSFSPATPKPVEASPHTVTLSGLTPGSDYVFRVRSKDDLDNEALSGNCAFTTSAAMPIKTVQQFIMQEESSVLDGVNSYNFNVSIPENPGNSVSLKTAIIEINGNSGASASNQVINIGLLRGTETIAPGGQNFTLESSSSEPTAFTILFDALNPPGSGQQNMQDLVLSGSTNSKYYTFFLTGTTTPIYILGAKLVLTYSYTP